MTTTRWVGVGAAIAGAVLYLLIGVGVLAVGESTQEPTTDLLAFGTIMSGLYVVIAVALWRWRSRIGLALIAVLQLVPLIGYVAAAGLREPPYEPWGVLIKACQVVVLVAAGALAFRATRSGATRGRPHAKGHPA
jgi:peptidoglycan/LPS O-acetylase OafA/YrhL